MQLEHVFPTPVGIFNFDQGLTQEQKDFLLGQEQRPNDGNMSSVERYILKNKTLDSLTTFIEKSLHTYLMATVCPKNDVRLRITQSWLNWTKPGQFHHKHSHPNSYISGCFYVNAKKETDKIYFYKDKYKPIQMPPIEWNTYNSDSWWFQVGTNMLVFFPSDLTHMVETVSSDETRVSLAFNTYPVGQIGDEDSLTSLKL